MLLFDSFISRRMLSHLLSPQAPRPTILQKDGETGDIRIRVNALFWLCNTSLKRDLSKPFFFTLDSGCCSDQPNLFREIASLCIHLSLEKMQLSRPILSHFEEKKFSYFVNKYLRLPVLKNILSKNICLCPELSLNFIFFTLTLSPSYT